MSILPVALIWRFRNFIGVPRTADAIAQTCPLFGLGSTLGLEPNHDFMRVAFLPGYVPKMAWAAGLAPAGSVLETDSVAASLTPMWCPVEESHPHLRVRSSVFYVLY